MDILPQVQEALTYMKSVKVTDIDDKLQAARVYYERLNPLAGAPESVYAVENRIIELPDRKISIRIYRPNDSKELPAVVYFHGGGFFKGSLDTHDRPLRQLANLSGVVIISVDYRLAPEYPFPHGLHDCIDATEWIMNQATVLGIDSNRIAVAGDSAGGTLAIAVARKLSGIVCQILIYPLTDFSFNTPSWTTFGEGPVLTLQSAIELRAYYMGDSITVAPVYSDDLYGVPDALIITAEYDPLVDEAALYAKKLREAHVEVTEKMYPDMIHGFFQFGGMIEQGREVISRIAAYIRYKLAK